MAQLEKASYTETTTTRNQQAARVGVVPEVTGFFHEASNTISYVVRDPETRHAAVIDPALDYAANSARTGTDSADRILGYIREHKLKIDWILETHAHADHLSAAQYLKAMLGAPVAIGGQIRQVQKTFAKLLNLDADFPVDGSQFDRLLDDHACLRVGNMEVTVLHTPGHTPACVSYLAGDAVFVGDTLFMPDYGTARADFPGGDARSLYQSIQKLFALPAESRMFVCHDYMPDGRAPKWQTSVAEQRRNNLQVHAGVSEDEFVAMREKRDARLDMPKLILPSIQVNIRAGALPRVESNGVAYLKIPINVLR